MEESGEKSSAEKKALGAERTAPSRTGSRNKTTTHAPLNLT